MIYLVEFLSGCLFTKRDEALSLIKLLQIHPTWPVPEPPIITLFKRHTESLCVRCLIFKCQVACLVYMHSLRRTPF